METPRVSVIMAAYNAENTISVAVESVQKQSFSDWELVVVDDGSTDHTLEVIERTQQSEVRLRVLHQENSRQAVARNTAIRQARGEFLAILDADDSALPERLKQQVEYLDAHPEVDVVGGWANDIDSCSGLPVGVQRRRETHDELCLNIYKECPFIASTVMGRRAFFERMNGFDASLPPVEDYDLWLRGYRNSRYHNLQVSVANYSKRTSIGWKHSFRSARLILMAAKRDGQLTTHFLYAFRPILHTALSRLRLRFLHCGERPGFRTV